MYHNYWGHSATTKALEPMQLQLEKLLQWNALALQLESSPTRQNRNPTCSKEEPVGHNESPA